MKNPNPAPNIVRTENGKYWMCTACDNIGCCTCLGGMCDPICDCGWPGYACHCAHDEDEHVFDDENFCSW